MKSLAALALLLACLAAACGYTTGLRMKSATGRTIGVEFFGNDTLERDLERDFQGELTRAIRDLTDASIASSGDADAVVRGTIREYHRRSGIRSPENVLLETGIYLEIEASLWRRGATKAERGPVNPSTWVGFVLEPTGENERLARIRAMKHVAEELVLDLFSPVH